jgi:hypothetical protein
MLASYICCSRDHGPRHRGVPRTLRLAKAYSWADLKIRKYEPEMRHKLLMRWRPLLVTRLPGLATCHSPPISKIRLPNPKSKLLIKSLNTSSISSSRVFIEAPMISIIFASFRPLSSSSASPYRTELILFLNLVLATIPA